MMYWPTVRYVGRRTGGFTQHGPTTRGYRFSPPYTIDAKMHPEDAAELAATGEYVIIDQPLAATAAPATHGALPLMEDGPPIQNVADGIKMAARRAQVLAMEEEAAAAAIAAQQAAGRQPAQVNDPAPAPITDPVHPAVLAMRRGYNQDMAEKMGAPGPGDLPPPLPQPQQRFSGPPGALRPADRPPQGAERQLWKPA